MSAALADEYLSALLDADPLAASLLGVAGYDDRMPDPSEAADAELSRRCADIAARARRGDGTDDEVTAAVVAHMAANTADTAALGQVEYSVSGLFTAPIAGLLTTLPLIPLGSADAAAGYLHRLRAMPAFTETVLGRHRVGIRSGRRPVQRLVTAAIEQLDRHLALPDDPLRTPLAQAGPVGAEHLAEAEQVLAETVRPALVGYREALRTDVRPGSRSDDEPGLCWLPDGLTAYETLAREHTTVRTTPEQLHRTGLAIIDGLREQYLDVGGRFFGTRDIEEIFARLRDDPALRFDSPEEILAAARRAVRKAEQAAPGWFGRLPDATCVVEPIPPVEAPVAPAAYYLPPAIDGSRPGTFYANTHEPTQRQRHLAEVTAYHEAVPGHHLQLSLAQTQQQLPLLRRLVPATAYGEGWGLYAERLADEMGLYEDDLARLGMLTCDSWRAARLVADTGLHAFGWTRAQTLDWMRSNTPMAGGEVAVEVDRYIACPGQALAYMVGRLELDRVRARERSRLGAGFDIRRFHDTVLGLGAVPLPVLDRVLTGGLRDGAG